MPDAIRRLSKLSPDRKYRAISANTSAAWTACIPDLVTTSSPCSTISPVRRQPQPAISLQTSPWAAVPQASSGMAAAVRKGEQPRPSGDASELSSSSISTGYERTRPNLRLLQSSYRRFFFLHVAALVPTFAILVAALVGSIQVRELCHLQASPPEMPYSAASLRSGFEKGQCRRILDAQLLLSTLALGVVGWLASYTSRKACLAFADRIIPRIFSPSLSMLSRSPRFQLPVAENASGREGLIVTVAIAMQALIGESLRVLSFYWACCILVTALYLYPIQERYAHRASTPGLQDPASLTGPDWAWRLSFRDPRFFVAAWSSIAWALAEASFGAFQILHQVALYKPADMDATAETPETPWSEADMQRDRAAVGQSGFSMLSGMGREAHPEPTQAAERGNGKARRMSASKALEQARQRLVQPAGEAGSPIQSGSTPTSYGAMDTLEEAVDTDDETDPQASRSSFSSETISLLDQELEEEVERFLVAKERSEVEAVLGVPLPEIPVALCALWRIDAMLWSIGSSLLLSSSFTHAQGALGHLSHDRFDLSPQFQLLPSFNGFGLTFGVLFVLHTIVSSLWATSLPLLGFATTTYGSLLFGLAIMVAALARWGLLI